MTSTISYYFYRLKELGLKKATQRLNHRMHESISYYRLKSKVLMRKNILTWAQFQKEASTPCSVNDFIQHRSVIENILKNERFNNFFNLDTNTRAEADKVASGSITFFGKTATFSNNASFPWHDDFFTTASPRPWYTHKKIRFYRDIHIKPNSQGESADIKVPWELSRMNHLIAPAYAASLTGDKKYITTCTEQIESWIKNNPYLIGVNWKCTMDVALRAINLLWIFYYLTDAKCNKKNDTAFFEKLIITLYQHLEFIKHNLELSDKPNNHYLADLVGLLYLEAFFANIPSMNYNSLDSQERFFKEYESQVFAEGTDYEGSTAYHNLVTELCAHGLLIITPDKTNEAHWKKLEKMRHFNNVVNNPTHPLNIGDNDSGKVVPHLTIVQKKTIKKIITYKEFGLSIISTPNIYLSFKHPVYHKRQPTGHFHADHLSITLSVNHSPIFVDPGSGAYTGNATLRNTLRSAESHSTFYLKNTPTKAGVILNNLNNLDLFQMPQVQKTFSGSITENEDTIVIRDTAELYESISLERRVTLNSDYHALTLCDSLLGASEAKNVEWNFIIHPSVIVQQTEAHRFTLMSSKATVIITTPASANLLPAEYSPTYGVSIPTVKITFTSSLKKGSHALTLITWNLQAT